MQHTLRTLTRILVVTVLGIGHMVSSSPTQCLALPPPSPTDNQSLAESPLQSADAVVSFVNNRFIIRAHAVPLGSVLASVTRETGVAFYLQGSAETPVTADFETGDLEAGIKRLIRGFNSVFYFGPSQPGAQEIRLTSVLIIANSGIGKKTEFRPPSDNTEPRPSAAMPSANPVEDIDRLYEEALTEDRALYEIVELAEFEENQERRLAAVEALGDTQNPEVESALLNKAMNDEDAEVRAAAVEALGSVSGEYATEFLVQALQDKDAFVRTAAVETLASNGGKEATVKIMMAMQDEDAQVRSAAVEALADIGDESAAPVLIKALDDPNEEVQESAQEALEEMGIK